MSKINEQKETLGARGFELEDLNNCSDQVISALYKSGGATSYIPKKDIVKCSADRILALDSLNRVPYETMFTIKTLLNCPVKNILLYFYAVEKNKIAALYEGANDDDVLYSMVY
jgi:hypothetical protein